MSRPVVPLANLQRRLPEAGRLRTGVQAPAGTSGKTRPKAIATWRATSHDEEAIRQLAAIYGGTPQPWTGSPTPGQWEVITEATELRIVLPPDPLGGTPIYEQWGSGSGCQRRCDGLTCQVPAQGPDGTEMTEVPCICTAKGEMQCKPHTRLSVILPDVKFGGTWRYESATSWNVAQEMPGMVDLIQSLQEKGLTRALLGIEHRKSAQTKKPFTIPVLRVADSLEAIAAGATRVGALPAGTPVEAPALNAGQSAPVEDTDEPTYSHADDNEVVDAVIIEDEDVSAYTSDDLNGLMEKAGVRKPTVLRKAHEMAGNLNVDAPTRFEDITPGVLLDRLCAWLREQ